MLKWFVIGMYALKIAFDAYVDHLRDKAAKAELPESVKDVYDEEEYKRWQAYHSDNRRLSTFKAITSAAINVILLATNVYSMVYKAMPGGEGVKLLLFALIFMAIDAVIDMPFNYYSTFTIETKYEMNRSTKKTFFTDAVKSFILEFGINCFLMYLIRFAFEIFGNNGIYIACAGVALFVILIQSCSGLFLRLFNKFTPLEEGSLRDKLTALCEKYGTHVKEISVMDMSRRTTKANAFCSGWGNSKKVALADNLVERYTEDQIVGVFAHEFGHAKHKHILKATIGNIISICVTIGIFGVILNIPELFTCFGFDGINYYFLFTLSLIAWPISTVISLITNYFGRRHEYQADAMAATEGYGEDQISALKQLYREALSDLNPHPFVVALEHEHPTLAQRIDAIQKIER